MTAMRVRATSAALILAFMGALAPAHVAAAVLWTMTASPLTATTGISTTFTMTATNEDPLASVDTNAEIGCIVLEVPKNFSIASAAVNSSSTGSTWEVLLLADNRVRVRTTSVDRLSTSDWVKFNVKATPTAAGSLAWSANAYLDQGCGGAGSLLGVPPIVLVTDAVVVPTLGPTPMPTPLPNPTPTPKPSQAPTTPKPSAAATPTPKPAQTSTPAPAQTPAPAGPVAPPPATPQATPSPPDTGAGPPPPTALPEVQPVALSLGSLSLLGGIDIWAIPGVIVGVPGLLVVLFIGLQAAGALAWVPAIRRLRGKEPAPVRA